MTKRDQERSDARAISDFIRQTLAEAEAKAKAKARKGGRR